MPSRRPCVVLARRVAVGQQQPADAQVVGCLEQRRDAALRELDDADALDGELDAGEECELRHQPGLRLPLHEDPAAREERAAPIEPHVEGEPAQLIDGVALRAAPPGPRYRRRHGTSRRSELNGTHASTSGRVRGHDLLEGQVERHRREGGQPGGVEVGLDVVEEQDRLRLGAEPVLRDRVEHRYQQPQGRDAPLAPGILLQRAAEVGHQRPRRVGHGRAPNAAVGRRRQLFGQPPAGGEEVLAHVDDLVPGQRRLWFRRARQHRAQATAAGRVRGLTTDGRPRATHDDRRVTPSQLGEESRGHRDRRGGRRPDRARRRSSVGSASSRRCASTRMLTPPSSSPGTASALGVAIGPQPQRDRQRRGALGFVAAGPMEIGRLEAAAAHRDRADRGPGRWRAAAKTCHSRARR